jgi:hypothetical protein
MKNKFFNAQHSPIGAFASLPWAIKGLRADWDLSLGARRSECIYRIGIGKWGLL